MTMRKMIPPELEGEYLIRVMDLPDGSRGFVVYDDDDFANVYVNARLNNVLQHKTADHEIDHISNDDIHSNEDIRAIEARVAGFDRKLRAIPRLMKARDLMPPKPPRKNVKLSPRQIEALKRCIVSLDTAYFRDIE